MNIRKICILIFGILLLSGCSSAENSESETVFTLSEEKQEIYDNLIEETLNSFYWRYDSDSITYFEEAIPSDEEILTCSLESGYDMSSDKGKVFTAATADLLYFNREAAGTVYFYFDNNSVNGMYYISPANTPCSMHVRNAYLIPEAFSKAESRTDDAGFTAFPASGLSVEGILDSTTVDGISYTAFSDSKKIIINQSDASSPVKVIATIDYSKDMIVPISAAFINSTNELAVLYGIETYSEEAIDPIVVPQKIMFFDSSFNPSDTEITAENSDLYSIGYDNGYLLVARSRSIDYYPVSGLNLGRKEFAYFIGKSITGMEISDLDGDGTSEYILTDGMDMYIYRKTDTVFKCIWSTHLSIESFENYICTGDLNRDGVSEIYVFDSTGTTSKYEIGAGGLYTNNENIEYGQRYHIADLNGDTLTDCLLIEGADINNEEVRIINP